MSKYSSDGYIKFTPEKLVAFHNAYEWAKARGDDVFVFEDRQVVTAFAKYLLQYVTNLVHDTTKK